MKTVLTIAGSDSSGGAGIQADIKTLTVHGVYAMSAVTALTAQNTRGITDVLTVSPDFLKAQLKSVFTDIPPDAVKIGMVATRALIDTIGETLVSHPVKHIVLDPVMIATSGTRLLANDAGDAMRERLFPLATVITPNIPEAEILSGRKINSHADMEEAAASLAATHGCAVLIKGGHSGADADDYLCSQTERRWFCGTRINTFNTHGTGCTLSSALAANLARGYSLVESIERAKAYLSRALAANLNLGHGSGPLNHIFFN